MRWTIMCFVVVFTALVLGGPSMGQNQALAVSGCCKERESLVGQWTISNRGLEQCKSLNETLDSGDYIFEEQGRVWWDITC